jgi:hypothetical protein
MIDLNKQLEIWLDDGIISAEQAELMRHSATGVAAPAGSPVRAHDEPELEHRIPIITEILGYVGAALAIWAVMFLVSEFWTNLSDWAQASLFATLALVLFTGGAVLLDTREAALRRLSSVLWAGSVIALGGALYVVFDPMAGLGADATWSLIGSIATIAAAWMMWKQPSVAQHVVLFAALLTAAVSLLNLVANPELFIFGFVVWGIGLAWVLVSRAGVLVPLSSGVVLGAMAMFVGAQITSAEGDLTTVGVLLGLGTAALFATAGVMLRERLLIIVGGIGIFWHVPQAMFHFFGETFGGMFGIFVTGMLIIGLAIWFGRHREAL